MTPAPETAMTNMTELPSKPGEHETSPYWEQFARLEQTADGPPWLRPFRRAGMTRFAELGFPTLRDEDWRFTNILPLTKLPFRPLLDCPVDGVAEGALQALPLAGLPATRLVFLNGRFVPQLSHLLPQPPGVFVGSLAEALTRQPALVESHLGRYSPPETDAFAALNRAFFRDGAFVYVPPGQALEHAVHLLFLTTATEPGQAVHTRNLIVAGPGSRLTVIEQYASLADGAHVTNATTELAAADHALVEHTRFLDEHPASFHLAALHLHCGRASNVAAHSILTGSRLARANIHARLAGEGLECVLNGLYLTRGEQLADHHMIVEHAAPHGASHEYFNGILRDRSKGVFHGRILVQPGAQKTDAKQTNKNLLLSDDATVNTKPQLEIYADDVKCTHGATIGQLDPEAIFYLRARGVGVETARQMLIHAFAGEIIERIQCEPLREELDRLVWDRLEAGQSLPPGN